MHFFIWMSYLFIFLAVDLSAMSLAVHAKLITGMQAHDIDPESFLIEQSPQWEEMMQAKTAKYYWDVKEVDGRANQLNQTLQTRKKIEQFLEMHCTESVENSKNILYFFGGVDFNYPDLFFPNMENIVIVGQEPIGTFPDVKSLFNEGRLVELAKKIGESFSALPFRSYSVTSTMQLQFADYGVKTMLAVGISLAGYTIEDCIDIHLPSGIEGVHLVYYKPDDAIKRNVFYFNFSLNQLVFPEDFTAFVDEIDIDTAFYKATSYVTQDLSSKFVNQFALDRAQYIIQSESGIPLRQFNMDNWDFTLFGVYARPYYSTQTINENWGMQTDLRDLYISLIWQSGNDEVWRLTQEIWPKAKYPQAFIRTSSAENLRWHGIAPLYFCYGGQLTKSQWKEYTSALLYAKKRA